MVESHIFQLHYSSLVVERISTCTVSTKPLAHSDLKLDKRRYEFSFDAFKWLLWLHQVYRTKKNIYRNDPIDLALLLPTVHHDDPIWTEQHQIKTLKVPQSAPLVRVIWYWSICSGKWPYCITNSCWFGGIFKPILWMWSIIIKEGNEWLEAIKIETNALSIHQVIGFILVVKVVLTLVGHLRFLFSGFQL